MTRNEAVIADRTAEGDTDDDGPVDDADAGLDSGTEEHTADGSASISPADRRDALRGLADRGGELAVEETRRALRRLDDGSGVDPETRRVLTTMAVRLSMRLLRRPAVAVEAGDNHVTETVAELFDPTE